MLSLSPKEKTKQRLKELDVLELSDKQREGIFDLLLTFYKNDEQIKAGKLKLEDKTKASHENNKNARGEV